MANKKIKGITIELGLDPTGLDTALKDVEKGVDSAKSNLQDVNRALKVMPESTVLWSQKQQILTTAIEESRKKLKFLEEAQEQVNQQFSNGKISQEQYFAFQRELEFARAEVGKFESQLTEVSNTLKNFGDKTSTALEKTADELKEIDKALGKAPESAVLWSQKQQILTTAIEESRKKLELLEEAQEQVNQQFAAGEISQEQYNAFRRKVELARAEVEELKSELKTANEYFIHTAGGAEEAAGAIKDMGEEAETAGDGFTVLKGTMADLASEGIQIAVEKFKELALEGETALASLQARTGATAEEMENYSDILTNMYGDGLGTDRTDLAESIAEVSQQLGDIDPSSLEEVSRHAVTLRDSLGLDVQENTRAAVMLMNQFDVSADQAYNLIAQGAQNGLNKNGDMLDVINEYGVHYAQMSYSAEEFFNSLVNGTATGVFSVDKLGDAMKEFGIRTKDTADSTTEGFEIIGLNADLMRQKFAEGGASAQAATKETITALFSLDDKVKQNQAGVALFGTMWEDLGSEAVEALMNTEGAADMTADALEEITDVNLNTTEKDLESLGRKFETGVLQPVVDFFMPALHKAVDLISGIISIASAGVGTVTDFVGKLFNGIEKGGEEGEKALEAFQKKCKAASEELTALQQSAYDTAEAQNTEIDKAKELWQELESLADASGRIKEADEARAQYIINELEQATGIEIGYVDGQIQKYDELCVKIDDVIAKKRAESFLTAYDANYTDYKSAAKEAQSDYLTKRAEYEAINNPGDGGDIDAINEYFLKNYGVEYEDANYAQVEGYKAEVARRQEAMNLAQANYNEATDAISRLDAAEEAYANGEYDKIESILDTQKSANEEAVRDTEKSLAEREAAFDAMCLEMQYSMQLANDNNSQDMRKTTAEDMVALVEAYTAGGLTSGVSFSDEFKAEIQKAIDEGVSFDSFILAAGNAGWDLGNLLGEAAVARYKEILARELSVQWQQKYETNNLIVKSINSPGDAALHDNGSYIPQSANGNFIQKGGSFIAEAGPELIRIMEDGVQVTPLTASARNQVVSDKTNTTYNNFTINATVSSDIDIKHLGQKLAAQIKASGRGKGK
ncbi:MAG: phage tail tape measure protein [Ruminococcus sp.]|nr:phage tail tape measure protein [Ruminococcus sp.]